MQLLTYSGIAVVIQYNLKAEYLYLKNMLRVYSEYIGEIQQLRNRQFDYFLQLNHCRQMRVQY